MPVQFLPVVELSNLNGQNGFKLYGENFGDYSGYSVSNAGDLNGDGINDLLIGAPNANSASGYTYVVFGNKKIGSVNPFALASLNGTTGFRINGVSPGDNSGLYANSAGDINDDGLDDIVVGAYLATPLGRPQAGVSYVIFGNRNAWNRTFSLASLNGINGFNLSGVSGYDHSGISAVTAGDFNNDGVADLIIGASDADPHGQPSVGTTYIVFGKPTLGESGIIELSSLNSTTGLTINGVRVGDTSGQSVSPLGDVNGDGIDDFIIGAQGAGNLTSAGISYVIFGRPNNADSSTTLELSSLNGTEGFAIYGADPGDHSGYPVSNAGDINSDGFPDIIIGAGSVRPNGMFQAGASYIIFGKAGIGNTGYINLANLNGIDGFAIYGLLAGDNFGSYVSTAGDVNNDGITDIIIGAQAATVRNQANSGISYVIFGQSRIGSSGIFKLSELNGTNGFVVNGISAGDISGHAVSSAGDINGDGAADIIISAPFATPAFARYTAGVSYVIFGVVQPPSFVINRLTLSNKQTLILNNLNLNITYFDRDPSVLKLTISNLQHGQFELVTAPGIAITNFLQQQVWDQQIQFVHFGSNLAPVYSISGDDGVVTTGLSVPEISFMPDPYSSTFLRNIAIGVSVGVVALMGVTFFSSAYLKNKAKQTLEQAIEDSGNRDGDFRRHTFSPIVKEVYRQMKISGCLGQLDKKTADRFIQAIQTLLEELGKQGVDLDLEKMMPENQQRLFSEIVRHIRFYTHSNSISGCICFFKAAVTPTQIEDRAHAIARGVADMVNPVATQPKGNTLTNVGIDEPNQPSVNEVFGDEKANEMELPRMMN